MIYLEEYPRPQLKRNSYINLNGKWMVKINKDNTQGRYLDYIELPYSPEANLSGVRRTLMPDEELWYRKTIKIENNDKERTILNFGAVDQICEVYINGYFAYKHVGGYTPFSIDITDFIKDNLITIEVKVKDYTELSELSRGKQSLNPKGIWYKAQSGIWQTVWLEKVPEYYIKDLKITPNVDENSVTIRVNANINTTCIVTINDLSYILFTNKDNVIKMNNPRLWSPNDPYLYKVQVKMGNDKINSYFGMRKIEIKNLNGNPHIFLNNAPIFLSGILEQGYYEDNLYTPRSYDTFLNDIKTIKRCGFNTIRKHVKIEPEMYYYYCDKEGILVIQDMVNGGGKYNLPIIFSPLLFDIHIKDNHYKLFSRNSVFARNNFEEEIKDVMMNLYNHPSVIMYTLFNEGWGQYDAKRIYENMQEIDPTRLIDPTSGWYDQGFGNITSKHKYIRKYKHKKDKLNRATILSEYGGYSVGDNEFFYGHAKNKLEYLKMIRKTIDEQIKHNRDKGLVGAIYTQYNDVEKETNGIVDKNRELKIDLKGMFKI